MIALGYMGAFLAGVVLGLLGGGGSILSVPLFAYLFGVSASVATAYSLFLVGMTSLVGTMSYLRQRRVDFRVGLYFLVPSMLGVWLARRMVLPSIPPVVLRLESFTLAKDSLILLVFALVMGLASYSMLRRKPSRALETVSSDAPNHSRISLYGLGAGALMGFVGAGGGFLIIPVLVSLGRLEMKRAVGTSLFIITVSSLFGFGGDVLAGAVLDWKILGGCTVLSIAGVLLGAQLSARVPSGVLKRAFGFLVLSIAILMVASELMPLGR